MSAEWFYVSAEKQEKVGPFDGPAFEALGADGTLTDDTLVWRTGWTNWIPFGEWRKSPENQLPPPPLPPPPAAGVNLALNLVQPAVAVAPTPSTTASMATVEICQQCQREMASAVMFNVGSRRICCDCKAANERQPGRTKRVRDPDEGWFFKHLLKIIAIGLVLAFVRIWLGGGLRFGSFSRSSKAAAVPASSPFVVANGSAEPWSSQPPEQWPSIALGIDATFKNHTPLHSGTAFLVQLKSGKVAALSAQHLVTANEAVTPPVDRRALDSDILKWDLVPGGSTAPISVDRSLWILNNEGATDTIALHLANPPSTLPTQSLKLRATPPSTGETVFIICAPKDGSQRQVVLRGKIEAEKRGRFASFGGNTLSGSLDQPADLGALSGSPVLDSKGHLVGIMAGWFREFDSDSSEKSRTFTAERASSLY